MQATVGDYNQRNYNYYEIGKYLLNYHVNIEKLDDISNKNVIRL